MTTVNIECPCGLVVASVEVKDGKAGAVSFESVPAFLFAADRTIELEGYGAIAFDIAYGGAFYALADCRQFGLEFGRDRARDFVDAATALTGRRQGRVPAVASRPCRPRLPLRHDPDRRRRRFRRKPTKNICVFAEAEVDRSPTGSGVTARLAAMHAKGRIGIGETRIFESIVGSRFSGAVARTDAGRPTTPSSPASAAAPSIPARPNTGSRTATSSAAGSW